MHDLIVWMYLNEKKNIDKLFQNTVSLFQYKYRLSSLIWLQMTMK